MIIVLFVLLLFVTSQAQENCSIVEPRKILCKEIVDSTTVLTLLRMRHDDRWICKRYYPRQGDKEDAVFTSDCGKIDSTIVVNSCLANIVTNMEDFAKLDSSKYAENVNVCNAYLTSLKLEIISGVRKRFPLIRLLYFLKFEDNLISEIHCFPGSYIRTYKANKLTGLVTDRKDYHDLKPGTYCQDFFATDELYWKP